MSPIQAGPAEPQPKIILQPESVLQETKQKQQEINVSRARFPLGDRTKFYIKNWASITRDLFILNCVQGCRINFISTPVQTK